MKNPPFLLNLPSEITTEIFLRLPIRTIILCKCVCMEFLKILSSSEFAKSHLSRSSTPGVIFNLTQMNETTCRVVEFEDKLEFQSHDHRYKLMMKFNPTECIDSPDTRIVMHNSVNGLLFLSNQTTQLDALYICNPITREYIALPSPDVDAHHLNIPTYRFGVSALSGHYKVICISYEPSTYEGAGSRLRNLKVKCSVYTLGTGLWSSIEHGEPYQRYLCSNGAFLNGNVHWLVENLKGSPLISCFDLETELFQPLPPPPFPNSLKLETSLTVLEDCLWFCEYDWNENIVVWVMKEYGVKESWTKQCVIRNCLDIGSKYIEYIIPLKAFKDGHILFLWGNAYMYCSKTETSEEVDLFERKRNGKFEAMSHTSSLLALKSFAMEKVNSF